MHRSHSGRKRHPLSRLCCLCIYDRVFHINIELIPVLKFNDHGYRVFASNQACIFAYRQIPDHSNFVLHDFGRGDFPVQYGIVHSIPDGRYKNMARNLKSSLISYYPFPEQFGILHQDVPVKLGYFVKRYDIHLVIKIRTLCVRNQEKALACAFQFRVSLF